MDTEVGQTNSYRVEVSGWDARENFFVEKTTLNWRDQGEKEITLRTTLREGCVVFVRFLQPLVQGEDFPIAYRAVRISARDASSNARVILTQLRPRPSLKETARTFGHSTCKVA